MSPAWGQSTRIPAGHTVAVGMPSRPGPPVPLVVTAYGLDGTTIWMSEKDAGVPPPPAVRWSTGIGASVLIDLDAVGPDVQRVVVDVVVAATIGAPEIPVRSAIRMAGETVNLPELSPPTHGSEVLTLVELRRQGGWILHLSGRRQAAPSAQAVVEVPPPVPASVVVETPSPAPPVEASPPSDTEEPTRAPRRRALAVACAALVAIAAVAGIAVVKLGQPPGLADPTTVTLPPATDAAGAVAFLRADGAPFVQLVDVTGALSDGKETAASCQQLATERLPAVADPPALLSIATRIPDPVTSELAVAHFGVVVTGLQACAQGRDLDRERLAFTRALLVRRFQEIGLR